MNLFVLSDIHIDTRDSFGVFQWNELDLIMNMEEVRMKYKIDKVILNGDIFELLKYSYGEIASSNKFLIRYFKNSYFVYIRGNHDVVNQFGLEYYDLVNSSGQKIHIEHGHNADWFNGTIIGRAICTAGFSVLKNLVKSKLIMNLYFRIVSVKEYLNHVPKRYNTLKYLTYALKLLKEHDVVILGHTHKMESHHTYYLNRKKRYLNCGACSFGRFQGIVFDTETLNYEMIREKTELINRSLKSPYIYPGIARYVNRVTYEKMKI